MVVLGPALQMQNTYHELLLDSAEAVETRLELEVVVSLSLGDGGDDGDPVALGADVVGRGNASDVDICHGSAYTLAILQRKYGTYRSCGQPETGE